MQESERGLPGGTEIPLKDLSVLTLRPGDYLVVRCEGLSDAARKQLVESVMEAIPEANGRVLFVEGGVELAVLRPEAE